MMYHPPYSLSRTPAPRSRPLPGRKAKPIEMVLGKGGKGADKGAGKGPKCYKCQNFGHIAVNCPN